jgi:DNA-binding transcriptional ArsR family regulator
MEPDFLDSVAARFRVLSHPVRLRILALLEGERMTVKDIQETLDLQQASVSQHLTAMRTHGILGYEREGNRHIYYVKAPSICGILRCIEKVHDQQLSVARNNYHKKGDHHD